MQRRWELDHEELAARRSTPPVPAPDRAAPEPALLALQRSAGNAALALLLQREPEGAAFTPVRPGSPLSMRPPGATDPLGGLTAGVMGDYATAMDAVYAWFDRAAKDAKDGGSFVQSVAELVDMAGSLTFKRSDGKEAKVREVVKPNELELGLRERAKTLGVRLLEHRAASDREGVKSETMAILRNLGRIPTSVEFGGDDAKIEVSIFGKVTAEAEVGKAKLEGEASPGGTTASVTVPAGKAKLEGHVSTGEGGGASVAFPGGKVGIDVTSKGIKAEVKAGDLITVKGSVGKEGDGSVAWKASITIGTLGGIVTAEEVAKVMKGAEETFSKSAGELVRGLGDPEKIKEHGSALKEAVTEVAEKAKKSASQAKPGWSIGLEAKGTDAGGFSGSITLTWVF